MGVEPPFIYDKPSTYTFGSPTSHAFNPKAATEASWAPKSSRPKQNGPLVDFNKHPDTVCFLIRHHEHLQWTDRLQVCSCSLWQSRRETHASQYEAQRHASPTDPALTESMRLDRSYRDTLLRHCYQQDFLDRWMDHSDCPGNCSYTHRLRDTPSLPSCHRTHPYLDR